MSYPFNDSCIVAAASARSIPPSILSIGGRIDGVGVGDEEKEYPEEEMRPPIRRISFIRFVDFTPSEVTPLSLFASDMLMARLQAAYL